jgi:hypothetical protein
MLRDGSGRLRVKLSDLGLRLRVRRREETFDLSALGSILGVLRFVRGFLGPPADLEPAIA